MKMVHIQKKEELAQIVGKYFNRSSTKFSRKLSPGPQCRLESETSLMYRTAEKLHLPMHLVNVKIKNYLQGKCFITDIAVIKGSIGRGF